MAKLILALALLLAGCSTTKVEYRYLEVPEPPIIERPLLETEDLNKGDNPGVVIEAHRRAILRLQAYAMELEAALNAYRRKQ